MRYPKLAKAGRIAVIFIVFLFTFLMFFSRYMVETGTGIDALLYTVTANTGGTSPDVLINGALYLVPRVIGIFALVAAAAYFTRAVLKKLDIYLNLHIKGKLKRVRLNRFLAFLLIICLVIVYPAFCFHEADNDLLIIDYIKRQATVTTIYEDKYVDAGNANIIAPEKGKNLIFLWLESMETTYADAENGGAQSTNLIPRLTELAKDNLCFSGTGNPLSGLETTEYTSYTFGALFAAISATPYAYNIRQNVAGKQTPAPSTQFLTDILKSSGYNTEYITGSEAKFAGTGSMLQGHGVSAVYDINTMYADGVVPDGYYVNWGVEDFRLYDVAKTEITRLSGEAAPFAVIFATLDTHFPKGYVCEKCQDEYDDVTSNVIDCADRQATEFVEWCASQPFYEDTVIVILGDHPRMDSELVEGVDSANRKLYNCFINTSCEAGASENRIFTMLDITPTLLSALGFKIENERLGFGVNLLSGEKTLPEELGLEYFKGELVKKSEYFISHF